MLLVEGQVYDVQDKETLNKMLFKLNQNQTRNKSNANFEALQYRQDMFPIAHYYNRKNSVPIQYSTRCSENHNNKCAENQKNLVLKFETL